MSVPFGQRRRATTDPGAVADSDGVEDSAEACGAGAVPGVALCRVGVTVGLGCEQP